MKQFYFLEQGDLICWSEKHFQVIMEQEDLTEIKVFKAEPIREKGLFWCSQHAICGDDTTETCGKQCKEYMPRNGKNGRCKFHSVNLFTHGESLILKKK